MNTRKEKLSEDYILKLLLEDDNSEEGIKSVMSNSSYNENVPTENASTSKSIGQNSESSHNCNEDSDDNYVVSESIKSNSSSKKRTERENASTSSKTMVQNSETSHNFSEDSDHNYEPSESGKVDSSSEESLETKKASEVNTPTEQKLTNDESSDEFEEYSQSTSESESEASESEIVNSSLNTRKRKRLVSNWTQNIRKISRNTGKKYKTKSGKIILPKTPKEYSCNCSLKCNENFNEDIRMEINNSYWSLADYGKQRMFINNSVLKNDCIRKLLKGSRRNCTYEYKLNDVRVCKIFYLARQNRNRYINYIQNRNRFITGLLVYINNHLQFDSVNIKYLESGHTQMEVDSMHSAIERAKKGICIYSPTKWPTILRIARRKNPYIVNELTFTDFYDLKHLFSGFNHGFKHKGLK